VNNIKRPTRKLEETFNLLMETTPKPKVTIPLVAAIPIPYTTIPINLLRGKIDTSVKTNIKSVRSQPYSVGDSQNRSGDRKSCSNCNNQTHNQTTSGEQTAANIKVSNMYNQAFSPMLILPFASTKPSQKTLPNLYNQHPLSVSVFHHAKKDDSSRVI
jgi:hypothetical protein